MYWQKRFDREDPDKHLENVITQIHIENKDYGYRRVYRELRNRKIFVNKKKVQRIIQKLGLQVTSFTRKSRKYSSYKGKVGTVAPNRIRRRFNTNIPHQKITTDTTEFKYYEVDSKGHMTMHKLYLDPFMDMCNGEIISFGIDKHPSAENVMGALEKAITITSDCPYRRTFHSDQGWAYQMKAYSRRLKEERIFQSMSRKGNCLDNACAENFFGILKSIAIFVFLKPILMKKVLSFSLMLIVGLILSQLLPGFLGDGYATLKVTVNILLNMYFCPGMNYVLILQYLQLSVQP